MEELYRDYVVLLLAGYTPEAALADLATYVHPIQLARLKKYIAAERQKKVKVG